LFGHFVHKELRLNRFGKIAKEEWLLISEMRPYVELDEFIIMPNHIHGIVYIHSADDIKSSGISFESPKYGLSAIIRGYKSRVTSRVQELSQKKDDILELAQGASA